MGRGDTDKAFEFDLDISRFGFDEGAVATQGTASDALIDQLGQVQEAYWAGDTSALGAVASQGRQLLADPSEQFLRDVIFTVLRGDEGMRSEIGARLKALRLPEELVAVEDGDLDDFEQGMADRVAPELERQLKISLSPLNTQGVIERVVERQSRVAISEIGARRFMSLPEETRFSLIYGDTGLGASILAYYGEEHEDGTKTESDRPEWDVEEVEDVFRQLVFTDNDDKKLLWKLQANMAAHLWPDAVMSYVDKTGMANKTTIILQEMKEEGSVVLQGLEDDNDPTETYIEEWSRYSLRFKRKPEKKSGPGQRSL